MKKWLRSTLVRLFRSMRNWSGWSPPEVIFRHLHFQGPFTVTMPNGKKVNLYSWGNRVENELAWRGWDGHEPVERQRWTEMVREGGDVLDVGANTGTYAITAKCISPDSRVIAFEPLERIAQMARKNVDVSGCDVTIVRAAVGRRNGELPIFDPGGQNAYSASLDSNFLPGEKKAYNVPVVSIDSYCADHGLDPASIKLDVEGYEGEAICGAQEILARGKVKVICEWCGTTESHARALEILTASGYVALDPATLQVTSLAENKGHADRNVILVHQHSSWATGSSANS